MLDHVFLTIIIMALAYLSYCIGVNDYATGVLFRKKDSINDSLKEHGYELHEITYRDISPCEVRFSVIQKGSRPPVTGLSSRAMLRRLNRAKTSNEELLKLVTDCNDIERKYRQNQKAAREF